MPFTGPEVRPWHEAVDWSLVAAVGHRIAWCPATAGIATVHPWFRANWSAMADAGLVRGAVHTLSTSYVGRGEARHFANVLGDPTGLLTAVAVQPDGHRLGDRLPGIDQVAEFAAEWHELTGHPLLIRTSWRYWATRDPTGRGRHISPYLWHTDSAWAMAYSTYQWAPYGGWLIPTIWSTHRVSCDGVAGLCGITLYTGHQAGLDRLRGLQAPEPYRRRLLRRIVDRARKGLRPDRPEAPTLSP